jgi:predicted AAA+ superfamily ATPase
MVKAWHQSFIKTYIERDLPNLGLNTSSTQLFRLISMLAHNQASIWNASQYAKSLGVSSPTITNYADYIENSYLIRRLQPFFTNAKKRIIKAPKLFIRDSGIVHHLIGISEFEQLLGHPVVGNSWEAYVIDQIISTLEEKYHYFYYRTQDGTECDLLLVQGNTPKACIEIKFSTTPKKTKSFTLSIQDLKTEKNFIIIPGNDNAYPLEENIMVCSLDQFLMNLVSEL